MPSHRPPNAAAPAARKPAAPTLKSRSAVMFSGIASKAPEKRDKNERLLHVARPVAFDLQDLRVWLTAKSEGCTGEVWRCWYCTLHLAIEDVQLDHAEPLARGGSNTLANLRICCKPDNLQKGELTEDEYVRFRAGVMEHFGQKAQQIILGALRLAAMGRRMRFHPRTPAKRKAADDHLER